MKIPREVSAFRLTFSATTSSILQNFPSKPAARANLIITDAVWRSVMEIPSLYFSLSPAPPLFLSLPVEEIPVGVHFNFSIVLFLPPTSARLWRARKKGHPMTFLDLPASRLLSPRHLPFHDKFISRRLLRLTAFILLLAYHISHINISHPRDIALRNVMRARPSVNGRLVGRENVTGEDTSVKDEVMVRNPRAIATCK